MAPATEEGSVGGCGAVTVMTAVGAYLTLRVCVWPGVPVLLGGDQGLFWMYGDRMLRGEIPYRDFFQFTPPGTDVVYFAAFALLGTRVWVVNAIVVLLGAALGGVSFQIARGFMRLPEAALASAMFTVWVFGELLSGTHHGFCLLVIMMAVLVLSPRETRGRLILAGALLGMAGFFTQTHATFALIASIVFVSGRGQRTVASRPSAVLWLVLGFALASVLAWAPLVRTIGIRRLWWCLVDFPWHFMGFTQVGADLGLPQDPSWRTLPTLAPYLVVYASVPLAYLLTHRALAPALLPEPERDRIRLLWLVGVGLLVGVAINLTWVRLFGVSMPAVILLVGAIVRTERRRRLLWAATIALACVLVRSTHRHHAVAITLPGGRVATDEATRDELSWLTRNDPPGGTLFSANRQSFLLPLGLRDPLYLDGGIPGGTVRAPLVERTVEDLASPAVRYVLWSPDPFRAAMSAPEDDEFAVARYLGEHFRVEQGFANGDEVWVRRTSP
jgi:hypothetical protein